MSIPKLISFCLLGAFVILTTSAVFFIPSTMFTPMEHDGCFGQTCGPIQHLLHNFTFHQRPFPALALTQTTIAVIDQKPAILFLSPDTPPPRTGGIAS